MPSLTKAQELATKFEEEYPEVLSERLAWWCKVLGINRSRFLRMMGMSEDEVNREKNASWSNLLKNKEREENGWWVEGKLHELLALFDYDWIALANRLHHLPGAQEKLNGVTVPRGNIVKLQSAPRNDGTEILLNQIARGGPESFPALISYLARERSS